MKRNTALTAGLGLAIALTGVLGLAACGSEGSGDAGTSTEAAADVDVAEDLQTARQAVLDALADDDWAQVMLASDVDKPTVKYGLMVMPFVQTDAVERVTGTVTIENGSDFVIEAVSAATGQTWQIDQDGSITEVAE